MPGGFQQKIGHSSASSTYQSLGPRQFFHPSCINVMLPSYCECGSCHIPAQLQPYWCDVCKFCAQSLCNLISFAVPVGAKYAQEHASSGSNLVVLGEVCMCTTQKLVLQYFADLPRCDVPKNGS